MTEDSAILEEELVRNERFVTHSKFGEVRLTRPTPADTRRINEQRRQVYHQDLRNPDILAKKQVQAMVLERGIWTKEDEERMQDLTIASGDLMVRLTALGYDTARDVYTRLVETQVKLLEIFQDADTEIIEAIGRFFDLEERPHTKDAMEIRRAAPNSTVDDLMEEAEKQRLQADLLKEFYEVKTEWNGLAETYAHFFGDTIESRADAAEKMAQVYYCARKLNGDALWPEFGDMWNESGDDVAWLSAQLFYFHNGITTEYAETLQKHGFMARVDDTGGSSESSQEHPQPNSDGEFQDSEPQISSESETPTS